MIEMMSDEDRKRFAELIRDYGLIGMIRALATTCHNWTIEYEGVPAVRKWRVVQDHLEGIAAYLARDDEGQK